MSRRRVLAITAATAALGLGVAACGASSSSTAASPAAGKTAAAIPAANHNQLTLLFGSSGPPETAADTAAAKAFTAKTGIPVSVLPAANKTEELAQDFAGNQPPNLFYLGPTSFQGYAQKGVLYPYAAKLGKASDFYSSLTSAFTYKNQLVCDPKDASTLSLYINNADWKAAGLTAADYPKNWSQLASVAKKLTTDGRVGLVTDPSESRLDAFFYQDGGRIFNPSRTKVVLDSAANVKALDFVKGMLTAKTLAYPAQLSSGDGEDAFGSNKAAMVITGNWMTGTMKADYPSVSYTPLALPAGPTGTTGDLTFTNCWGVPTSNDKKKKKESQKKEKERKSK
jgi:multiple sugar transport system substrate-binding protein